MKDEQILDSLRRAATASPDPLLDPRLEALARGDLSAEERAQLEETLCQTEQGRDIWLAFQPPTMQTRDALANHLIAMTEKAKPRRARLPSRTLAYVGIFVAVASVGLFWTLRKGPSDYVARALPAYALQIEGGDRPTRKDPTQVSSDVRLAPHSRLTFVLRPATNSSVDVSARAFLLKNDVFERLGFTFERAPSGALRVSGTREELFPQQPNGPLDVIVVLGKPEHIPQFPDTRWLASANATDVQILRAKITLTPEL